MDRNFTKVANHINKIGPKYKLYGLDAKFSNKEVFDMEFIAKNRDTLSQKEIENLYGEHSKNKFICCMLLECKNTPIHMVKRAYDNFFGNTKDNSRMLDYDVIMPFWSINFDKDLVKNNVSFFVDLFNKKSIVDHRQYIFNDRLTFECAKELFYKNSGSDRLFFSTFAEHFLSKLSVGNNVSEKEIIDFFEDAFLSFDVPFYNEKCKAMTKNHDLPVSVLEVIMGTDKEVDQENLYVYCPPSRMEDFYQTAVSHLLKDDKYMGWDDRRKCAILLANPSMTGGMKNDFVNRLITHPSSQYCIDEIIRYILFDKRFKCDASLPDTAWYSLFIQASPNIKRGMLLDDRFSHDFKVKCCEQYFRANENRSICKSAGSLINTFTIITEITSLPGKRYFQLDNPKIPRGRIIELIEAIRKSPYTPINILADYKKTYPFSIENEIALFCALNGVKKEGADAIYNIFNRNFDGNSSKARLNIQAIENILNNVPCLNELFQFIEDLKDECRPFSTEQSTYFKNADSFKKLYREFDVSHLSPQEFLKKMYPKYYYSKLQTEAINDIINIDNKAISFTEMFTAIQKGYDKFISLEEQKNEAIKLSKTKKEEIQEEISI